MDLCCPQMPEDTISHSAAHFFEMQINFCRSGMAQFHSTRIDMTENIQEPVKEREIEVSRYPFSSHRTDSTLSP